MTAPLREHALRTPDSDARTRMVVQRKCGCGGSCGPCAEKKKAVQRRALDGTTSELPRSVESILGGAGRALDAETRASMESRFGRSFADVRVHTDTHAADSAKDIHAAAYTSGTHIVFGAGRYEPHTPDGRRLLAHELAHVVQQRDGFSLPVGVGPADDVHERAADRIADAVMTQGPSFVPPPLSAFAVAPGAAGVVRRKREDESPASAEEEAQRFLVEDSVAPAAGQMRRRAFVEELDATICATSREAMATLGRSTEGCPLLDQWRPRIRTMSTRQLEVSLRRWVGSDATIRTARDYIPRVSERLAQSIRTWGRTGQILGVPPDLLDLLAGGKIKVSVGGMLRGAIGSLFRKSRDGAAAPAAASVDLDARGGRPLDGSAASRMGRVFGRDFSNVRVHTGAEADAAAARVHARAFTIGDDIAFAGGEYAPGTLVGDALLAHELAHVAQQSEAQSGAEDMLAKSEGATASLEQDADDAAVHAVMSLWPRVRRWMGDVRANAIPRLKSSLQLQRCSDSPKDLQKYLGKLDEGKIEGNNASDGRARDIAEAWSSGDTQYVLTARRKKLLIEEMLDGWFSGADQKQILNLLERTWDSDLPHIIGPRGIPHKTLLDKFDSYKAELHRFYMRRYTGAYPESVQQAINFGDEGPEPQAPPDLAKLDATEPSSWPSSTVQFGDPLPETTQPSRVGSKRSFTKLDKTTAVTWVDEVFGKSISDEQRAKAGRARTSYDEGENDIFVAFVAVCLSERLERMSDRDRRDDGKRRQAEDQCRAEEPGTSAFYDPSDNSITTHRQRETPSTMIHEVLHALANERVHELGRFGLEGLTEYLSRLVIARHSRKEKEQPLFIGGHYDDAYDALQELAIVVGEDLLVRVHFQGATKELCNALGKAKYEAWNAAMEIRGNGRAATDILRAKSQTKEPCK